MGLFDFNDDSNDSKNESKNPWDDERGEDEADNRYLHQSTGSGGFSEHFDDKPASVDTCDTCKEEREADQN